MKIPRQLALWALAALASLGALAIIVARQQREISRRLAVQVAGTPLTGATIFRNKGCADCHGPSGGGTTYGPSLRQSASLTGLPQLVTAMWNHAPRMWQEMDGKRLHYPVLTYEETSQLATYLYMCAYADDVGDAQRGEILFKSRKCGQCHSDKPNAPGRQLELTEAKDPVSWAQALWNHAAEMHEEMLGAGMQWPTFDASDTRDLFAYVRNLHHDDAEMQLNVSGDPDRGWDLFQQKGCIRCHSISSAPGLLGPGLGPNRKLPPTYSEFGAALLNHFPKMQAAMQSQGAQVPRFEGNDVADIAVFLYSLHYLEPTGSTPVGHTTFSWRGCNNCHGDNAEGTATGPALRGRGQVYTAVRLATALWAHGGRMYDSARKNQQAWPLLEESDVGHLLSYLNTSP